MVNSQSKFHSRRRVEKRLGNQWKQVEEKKKTNKKEAKKT